MEKLTFLIVDDEARIRKGLRRFLRNGDFRILEASSAEQAKNIMENNAVGILIADQQMGGISGLELLRWAKKNYPDTVRVMLTGYSSVGLMQDVINKGEVFRFVTKPWENDQLKDVIASSIELCVRTHQQRRLEGLQKEQEQAMQQLEERFQGAWRKLHENKQLLHESRIEAIRALAIAVDAKDPYTHGHMERVSATALKIAQTLDLPADQRDAIQMAGMLHDVGKIGVPDNILLYPGDLSEADWVVMKLHPEMGGRILDPIKFSWNLRELIEAHHERYDGTGYPQGLKGDEIPLGSRILAVADAYDAMASKRRYRAALSPDLIQREIEKKLGSQFDPNVGKVFLNLMRSGKIPMPRPGDVGGKSSSKMENDNV